MQSYASANVSQQPGVVVTFVDGSKLTRRRRSEHTLDRRPGGGLPPFAGVWAVRSPTRPGVANARVRGSAPGQRRQFAMTVSSQWGRSDTITLSLSARSGSPARQNATANATSALTVTMRNAAFSSV
ncbi:hypothetical protein GCM10027610_057750 [Dactylosporangium cerinum]